VKRNAIAGHAFASLAGLEAHLVWWMREVADTRVHGTTGEAPIARFREKEAAALRPLEGRTTFQPIRECLRRVHADACIELETNRNLIRSDLRSGNLILAASLSGRHRAAPEGSPRVHVARTRGS